MTQANDPAYPATDTIHPMTGERCTPLETGLTKREAFAMAAMQGLLANDWKGYKHLDPECDVLANVAVNYADALIASLNKEK